MDPIETMLHEHRIIERVIDALEQLALRAEAGAAIDTDAARQAVRFFREYADRLHHGKEEACLFEIMQNRGFRIETCNPAEVLTEEHVQGRHKVAAIAGAIDRMQAGDADASANFSAAAKDYVRHLRSHILKEDDILFPMAMRILTPEDLATLEEQFRAIDRDQVGEAELARLEELADYLAMRAGP